MISSVTVYLTFVKIAAFSFGGGYAMLALLQEEVVDSRGWLSIEEFLDAMALASSLPGPVALNSATYIGYKVAGITGAFAGVLGLITPSIVLVLALAGVFLKYRETPQLQSVLKAVHPAVIGLILAVAYQLSKPSIDSGKTALVAVVIFIGIAFLNISPFVAILAAGIIGLAFF